MTRREWTAHREQLLTRRATGLAAGQALLFVLLAGRLYQLQVSDSDRYKTLSDANRFSIRIAIAPRGRILDRFGVVLADNRPSYQLVLVPEQVDSVSETLAKVARLIQVDEALCARVLRESRHRRPFLPVVIRDDLTWEEMAKIAVATPELPGTSLDQGLSRHYPFAELTAHVTGYVAAVAEQELNGDPMLELPDFRIGKAGIEKSQDVALRGSVGTRQIEVNAFGRVVREVAVRDGIPGHDISIGLDARIQEFTTRRCAAEDSVAAVVLDAITGEILALVSTPSFDPNNFISRIPFAVWHQLSTDPRHPLSNKVIAGVYPPGSTFKPAVALAALTEGVLSPMTAITCSGQLQVGSAMFHCWRREGHGTLRLRDAIKQSCDVFFYETARRLGIQRFSKTARLLGFGTRTGIDIPGENVGLVPTPEWKLATSGVGWHQGETVLAGVGQGYVLATPLQIATMAARLVTGRMVSPHLVRKSGIKAPTGDMESDWPTLGVDRKWLAVLSDAMNAVVNEPGGTAYSARIVEPGLRMGGKSGTSQVRRITEYQREHGPRRIDEIPWKERDHALFVGFAPVGAPRYVCAIVVEHGGGGSAVAAPICRDILHEVQRRHRSRGIPATETIDASPIDQSSAPAQRRG